MSSALTTIVADAVSQSETLIADFRTPLLVILGVSLLVMFVGAVLQIWRGST